MELFDSAIGVFSGHLDRDLGAVALGEPGLVFQARGHGTVAGLRARCRNSSRSNISGASDLQRACPDICPGDADFQLSSIAAFPLCDALCRAVFFLSAFAAWRTDPPANRKVISYYIRAAFAVKLKSYRS